MKGLTQIVKDNSSRRQRQPGAHAAKAIVVATSMTPHERSVVQVTGNLPAIYADQVLREGYDDFLVAKLVREVLANGAVAPC